jgi:hypothetical protein
VGRQVIDVLVMLVGYDQYVAWVVGPEIFADKGRDLVILIDRARDILFALLANETTERADIVIGCVVVL